MLTDRELLGQYARQGDEAAFAEIVRRHADLVYSVARRMTANGALAQDVTQSVFTKLARQAAALHRYETIVGWLHTTTRYTAIDAIRGEERRRAREQEASIMQNETSAPAVNWEEIGPLLDEAVGRLREQDREAVLLRFFRNLSHQEVGAALGLSEDTARKRVERALEKLHTHFSKRGVTASSAVLAAAIGENSVNAAPIGLVAQATSTALTQAGGAGLGSTFLLSLFYMSTKTKTIIAAVLVLAIVATLTIKLGGSAGPPTETKSAVTTSTSIKPAPVAADLAKAGTVQVTMPTMKPVAASSVGTTGVDTVTSGTLTLAAPPPNADLKTAIPALIHYLQTDDFVHIIPFLMSPADVQKELASGHSLPELADGFRTELKNHGGPDYLLQGLLAVSDEAPVIDDTGTKAAFLLDPAVQGHKEIRFVKVDGLWYGPQ